MASFKKSISTNGTFKMLAVQDGIFLDTETGEVINVADIIESALGSGQPFDLKVSQKDEKDIVTGE